MIFVIDSNRIIAGLLKDSTTRRIILYRGFEFYTPEHVLEEISKYKGYLASKIHRTEEEVDEILYFLLENIEILPFEDFEEHMDEAISIMKDIDVRDAPFLAVGIAVGAEGIWTEDRDFKRQNRLRMYENRDMIEIMSSIP